MASERQSTTFMGPTWHGEVAQITDEVSVASDTIAVTGFFVGATARALPGCFSLVGGGAMVVPLGTGTGISLFQASLLYPLYDEAAPAAEEEADAYLQVPVGLWRASFTDASDPEVGATVAAMLTGLDADDQFSNTLVTTGGFEVSFVERLNPGGVFAVGALWIPSRGASRILIEHNPRTTGGNTTSKALVVPYQGDAQR